LTHPKGRFYKAGCQEINADLFAVPGHKDLLGPRSRCTLCERKCGNNADNAGGTGSRSESFYQPEIFPDMLESGTLNAQA